TSPADESGATQTSKLNPSAPIFEMAPSVAQSEQPPQVVQPASMASAPPEPQYAPGQLPQAQTMLQSGPGSSYLPVAPLPPVMPCYPMFYYNAEQPQQVVMM